MTKCWKTLKWPKYSNYMHTMLRRRRGESICNPANYNAVIWRVLIKLRLRFPVFSVLCVVTFNFDFHSFFLLCVKCGNLRLSFFCVMCGNLQFGFSFFCVLFVVTFDFHSSVLCVATFNLDFNSSVCCVWQPLSFFLLCVMCGNLQFGFSFFCVLCGNFWLSSVLCVATFDLDFHSSVLCIATFDFLSSVCYVWQPSTWIFILLCVMLDFICSKIWTTPLYSPPADVPKNVINKLLMFLLKNHHHGHVNPFYGFHTWVSEVDFSIFGFGHVHCCKQGYQYTSKIKTNSTLLGE